MNTNTAANTAAEIARLEAEIARLREVMARRNERIANGETDEDDCFMSIKAETSAIEENQMKIAILKGDGTDWFVWYTDMNGVPCTDTNFVHTKFGWSTVINFADGRTIWTTANTEKGLARKGVKKVFARFPVWVKFAANGSGMCGVYCGQNIHYRAAKNRVTGEYHPDPYEIKAC